MTAKTQSVTLRYFALLREQSRREQENVVTTAGTARDLYDQMQQRYHFTLPADKISVAINDAFCSLDQALSEGDVVVFIPPVAGG